jgi:hypothetical protein
MTSINFVEKRIKMGSIIKCNSVGLQCGVDIAFSKDKNVVGAMKTIHLFGMAVKVYGQGDTEEEAKKDLDENIVDIKKTSFR